MTYKLDNHNNFNIIEISKLLYNKYNIMLLYLYKQHYLTPYIAQQYLQLTENNDFDFNLEVVELFINNAPNITEGMYFPAAIKRELDSTNFLKLANKYSMGFINIKGNNTSDWILRGNTVVGKVKNMFLENTYYDAQLKRFFVEYALENRFDKTYFNKGILPLKVVKILFNQSKFTALLNNNKKVEINPATFVLNASEQIHCKTFDNMPLIFGSDARFSLLSLVQEGGNETRKLFLTVAGVSYEIKIVETVH